MKRSKHTWETGMRKHRCVQVNHVLYIEMDVNYLKKFTFIYCQIVLNFTLDISDGLIINRFTQRDERKESC